MKKNVERVVGGKTVPLGANVSGDCLRNAEKGHGLIDEMRRKIEKDSATGSGIFSPGVGFRNRAKTIVGGFEANDAAKIAGGCGFSQSLEIGVKATIMIDGEDKVPLPGEIQKFNRFGDCGGEWLVDDDVTPCFEAVFGEGEVRLIGSRDSDKADGIDGQQFIECSNDAGVRIELRGGVAGTLENGGKAQTFHRADNRGVKAAAAETKADKTDVNHEA
jgi:hypothetical protein